MFPRLSAVPSLAAAILAIAAFAAPSLAAGPWNFRFDWGLG